MSTLVTYDFMSKQYYDCSICTSSPCFILFFNLQEAGAIVQEAGAICKRLVQLCKRLVQSARGWCNCA